MDSIENSTKKKRGNKQNLILWKKGQSGNPSGKAVGQKNYATLYRQALIKLAKANKKDPNELELEILSNGIMSARKGDYRFYKDLLDRLLGTAVQNTDIKTGGEKITNENQTLANTALAKYLHGTTGNSAK